MSLGCTMLMKSQMEDTLIMEEMHTQLATLVNELAFNCSVSRVDCCRVLREASQSKPTPQLVSWVVASLSCISCSSVCDWEMSARRSLVREKHSLVEVWRLVRSLGDTVGPSMRDPVRNSIMALGFSKDEVRATELCLRLPWSMSELQEIDSDERCDILCKCGLFELLPINERTVSLITSRVVQLAGVIEDDLLNEYCGRMLQAAKKLYLTSDDCDYLQHLFYLFSSTHDIASTMTVEGFRFGRLHFVPKSVLKSLSGWSSSTSSCLSRYGLVCAVMRLYREGPQLSSITFPDNVRSKHALPEGLTLKEAVDHLTSIAYFTRKV